MLWSEVSDVSEIVLLKSYQLGGKLVRPKVFYEITLPALTATLQEATGS